MPIGTLTRYRRGCIVLVIAFICFNAARQLPAAAQGQVLRLGEMRVDGYCLQRGYGAWVINNGADWACTAPNGAVALMLSQVDYNAVCQTFYSNTAAYAVRERSSALPALDWACYVIIPPTATPAPSATPTLQPTRLGDFQVEWYCNERGLGVRLINNQTDWACTESNSDQVLFILSQDDFNRICQRTYNYPNAYAIRDRNKPEAAYNWSCYVNAAVLPILTPIPTLTSTPQLTRLGDFQVEWYCSERSLGVQVINNQTDWACTQANSNQIAFILTQFDFDQICRRTYNDQAAFAVRDQSKPQPAYNWSCYTNR